MTKPRNSVYLEQKAQSLQQALTFFSESGYGVPHEERLLTFLDQIDFWDWEVEELIFSFKNFKERSQAFSIITPGERAMTQGIMVKDNIAQALGWERRIIHNGVLKPNPVVAPIEALTAVLTIWHSLLDLAEKDVLAPTKVVENACKAGANYVKDLNRFRKLVQG